MKKRRRVVVMMKSSARPVSRYSTFTATDCHVVQQTTDDADI